MKRQIDQETKNQKLSSFDRLKGVKPRIEKHLKIDSNDQKESRQPKSFNLKIGFFFFFSIGQKTDSIDRILKNQKF